MDHPTGTTTTISIALHYPLAAVKPVAFHLVAAKDNLMKLSATNSADMMCAESQMWVSWLLMKIMKKKTQGECGMIF